MAVRYAVPPIITDGLVLYLDAANKQSYVSGSTTWYDAAGSNISGSLINGPTFNSGNGGSIVFDGVDDYVGLNRNFSDIFGVNNQNTSISVWLNWTSVNRSRIVNFYRTAALSTSVALVINTSNGSDNFGGAVGVLVRNSDDTTHTWVMYYDETYNTGDWVNVVVTTSSTDTKVYVNGVLKKTDSTGLVQVPSNTSNGTLATYNTATESYMGKMANTICYNKTLTASEVLQNYNSTKARFGL